MLNKGIKIGLYITGFLTAIALLIVAGFYDLQISTAIVDYNSFFAKSFSFLSGGTPFFLCIASAFVFVASIERKKHLILWIFSVFLLFFAFVALGYWYTDEYGIKLANCWYYIFPISIILTAILALVCEKIDKIKARTFLKFAVVVVLAVAISQGIVQSTKLFWCRLRFRNIINGEGFTPWYQPNWTTNGREYLVANGSFKADDAFKSFPSGHTCSAGVILAVTALPPILNERKNRVLRSLLYTLSWGYTALVGLARIIEGAHYLSDVVVGGLAGLMAVVVAKYLWLALCLYAKKRKNLNLEGGV